MSAATVRPVPSDAQRLRTDVASSTRTRRRWRKQVMVLAVGAAISAAACAPRNDYSAVERMHPSAVNVDSGAVGLRHVYLQGALDGLKPVNSNIDLHLTVVNESPMAIKIADLSSPAADEIVQRDQEGHVVDDQVEVRAGQLLHMQDPSHLSWVLTGLRHQLRTGSSVPITFHIDGGSFTVQVPVSAPQQG